MTKYFNEFLMQADHESTTYYLQIYFGKAFGYTQIPIFLDINYKHGYIISKTYLALQEQLLAAISLYGCS